MPVTPKSLHLWPSSRIPYEVNASSIPLQTLIDRFNTSVGFQLFGPRNGEAHYATFGNSPLSGHSPMGYRARAGQPISTFGPTDEFVVLHEMGHCVGLGHEHFHTNFPIDDMRVRRAWSMAMRRPSSHTEGEDLRKAMLSPPRRRPGMDAPSSRLNEQSPPRGRPGLTLFPSRARSAQPVVEYDEAMVNDLYMREVRQKNDYKDIGNFDPKSIMMYPDWLTAYANTMPGLPIQPKPTRLSHADVSAIRQLYPSFRFMVAVQGMDDYDSVVMAYEVRHVTNPGTPESGKTDQMGQAIVTGFDPGDTEIHFPGMGAGWTKVRCGQTYALPGGRYTYMCR